MSRYFFTKSIATLLMAVLLVPAAFLSLAPRTEAAAAPAGCIIGLAAGLASVLSNKTISVSTGDSPGGGGSWTTAGSTVGNCIYSQVVLPLLRQMIRGFLQDVTKQTVDWINGGTGNSTGRPEYVPNLSINLQGVADAVSVPYINDIATQLNSPFARNLSTVLALGYRSSMGGFYAANQCTLPQYSANVTAFLNGDWSQGGTGAWFALTTQNQNNPYTLHEALQSQLYSQIDQAVGNRRQDLLQSGGILSFCQQSPSGATAANGTPVGINPGDPCITDGHEGTVQTPGTVIQSYLQANVNSGIGQLVSAQDLDGALSEVVGALANRVLGPTGLFGSSQPSYTYTAPSYMGLAPQSTAASSGQTMAQSVLSNAAPYTAAWQTVSAAAMSARADVTALQNSCTTQSAAARTAITTQISPALAQAQTALTSIPASTALATQVNQQSQVVPLADPVQFSQEVLTLSNLPPSPQDVASVQAQAQLTGGAQATPVGSLNVSGGSLVDQMNLLSTNARALSASCP